jgi:hypothetical protein
VPDTNELVIMWRQRNGRDGDRRRWLEAVGRFESAASSGDGLESAIDEFEGFSFPVVGVGQDVSFLSLAGRSSSLSGS